MTIPTIAFFNNRAGVGKTTLVYHLAWMFAELGLRVVAADLDPQSNLTAAFLDEAEMERVWETKQTLWGAVQPFLNRAGNIQPPILQAVDERIHLLASELALSNIEDELAKEWPACLTGNPGAFRVSTIFAHLLQTAAAEVEAQAILIDLGPNLGALNRAALIATEYVVVPLASDLFSLQGLRNLGPTLVKWRADWNKRLKEAPDLDMPLPQGQMRPIGYVVLQHAVRLDHPVKAYERWANRIPRTYHQDVLDELTPLTLSYATDKSCLTLLKNYSSLIPLAQEARKPIFALKPADGVIGSHAQAVQVAYKDFRALAAKIAERTGIDLNQ